MIIIFDIIKLSLKQAHLIFFFLFLNLILILFIFIKFILIDEFQNLLNLKYLLIISIDLIINANKLFHHAILKLLNTFLLILIIFLQPQLINLYIFISDGIILIHSLISILKIALIMIQHRFFNLN